MREALKDWAWRYSASATCWDGEWRGGRGGAWDLRDRRVDSLVGAPLAGLRETLPMGEGSTHAWWARGNRRVLSASSGMKLTNMLFNSIQMTPITPNLPFWATDSFGAFLWPRKAQSFSFFTAMACFQLFRPFTQYISVQNFEVETSSVNVSAVQGQSRP